MNEFYNPFADEPEIPDDMPLEERKEIMFGRLLIGCVGYVVVPFLVLSVMLLLGCCTTSKHIVSDAVRTDTVIVNNTQRDSIYIETLRHDSVFVQAIGDTIIFTHWRTEYRDRWRDRLIHDSIYIAHTDTLRTETTVEVEKRLSLWQRARMTVGTVALLVILLAAFLHIVLMLSGGRR